ncbi:MAG: transporter substrate-binding domain-containing protein [Rheinheimera sp.]|nr:transporter substrate-binding domain-containing protein [Rheinheimera sp.]
MQKMSLGAGTQKVLTTQRRTKCAGVAAMLISLWFGTPANAAATFKTDMIQFDPWTRLVAGGNGSATEGIIVDLLNEFERRSGYKTERTMVPYARVEQNLQQGSTDFALMAWGEARARYAERGSCLVPLSFGVRARKNFQIPDYDSLYKIRIGTPRGLKIDPRYDADTVMNKQLVLDYTTGVMMAGLGRDVDAVAGSLSTINYLIEQNQMQDKFDQTLVLNTTHLAVAFSRKSPLFAKRHLVNAVFDAMTQDGTARAIYDKWLGLQSHQLTTEAVAPRCQPAK